MFSLKSKRNPAAPPKLSFPRRRESLECTRRDGFSGEIPAFAGMTVSRIAVLGAFAFSTFLGGLAHAQSVDFNRDIRPILADRCFQCHGPDANARKAELRLDIEADAKKAVIVAGDPDASDLIHRISSTDPDKRMPAKEAAKPALTPDEIALFRAWITEGAQWAKHWAFVPPVRPETPKVQLDQWPRNGIDAFVLARLEAENLRPSPESSLETLIRRLSFDLTGLPPTLQEIDAFVTDNSPDAYERAVDRLLESPAYGEHLARQWLDGARYADTNGYQNDFQRHMWPWRDWVISAFNANMPFDQFTIEQIAGDLLPDATQSQIIATGFNRNNRSNTEGGSIEDEWRTENIIDRVETTSNMFLGLSMGCARCHDHKYDPITQKEFYKFFAFFNSTEDLGFYNETRGNTGPIVSLPSEENNARTAEFDAQIAAAKKALANSRGAEDFAYAYWLKSITENTAQIPDAAFEFRPREDLAEGKPALLDSALELPGGADSQIDLGQAVAFDRERAFSVSMWVRPDSAGALFSKMDDANGFRGIDTLVSDKGVLAVHIVNAWDQNAIRVTSERSLRMNQWSHVGVTYDGSSKAAGLKIFVNGVAAPIDVDQDSVTDTIAVEQPFRIGRRSASEPLTGAVADLRVFDRVIEPAQVEAIVSNALQPALALENKDARDAALDQFFEARYSYQLRDLQDAVERTEEAMNQYVRDQIPTVMVMKELGEPRETYRLKRGAYDAPDTTEALSPGVPSFLPELPADAPANRLTLAQWLVNPANPLTARVVVNRVWNEFFGHGIVKTVEDFGSQGSPPTHPELLDWLATEFLASGWDLKALQKLIVTSATYRQDSAANAELIERDPESVLYARGPRFRLPAELIRDNALAVSGLLVPKMGGPSVMPYQPEGLWAELAGGAGQGPYVQAVGEDLYRRSLYTYRKRTVPPPSLTTFDSPSWEQCRVRRGRTNTPLQALALLNDVTYVEAARRLAERMLTEAGPDAPQRIVHGFRLATGRAPSHFEQETLTAGLNGYLATYAANETAATEFASQGESAVAESLNPIELAAYTAVGGVLLNLDETITKE